MTKCVTHMNLLSPYTLTLFGYLKFGDLAPVYQRYIVSKASTRAATQMVANKELAALLATQESFARAACMEYECNQGDYTIFGTPDGTSYRPYQPYRALNRQ